MTKLSVNINKVALIRNGRGGNLPDLKQFAIDCESSGADGITVHPRPDERHIRYDDLPILKDVVKTEFNIEGYPSDNFLNHVCSVKPTQCTLVPDPPGVLTSDSGWRVGKNQSLLLDVIQRLHAHKIRVSLFVNADTSEIEAAKKIGADRVELYTGDYAKQFDVSRDKAIEKHIKASQAASSINIGLNAGHDLNLKNLRFYSGSVNNLLEVSIGHALVCDMLYYGMSNTIMMYKRLLSIS